MKRIITGIALVAAAFLAGSNAQAQFTLSKSVIANGGGPMTSGGSGSFTMNSTIGQAAIGAMSTPTNTFTAGIGFWYPQQLTTGVEVVPGYTAAGHTLHQNFPNPFRGETMIKYTLAKAADVTLKVFNAPGQEITTLVSGRMEAGDHQATFEINDLPSGTYFYQLQVGTLMLRRQMVVVQ